MNVCEYNVLDLWFFDTIPGPQNKGKIVPFRFGY